MMADPLVVAQIVLAAVQDIVFAAVTGMFACGVMGQRSGLFAQDALRVWRSACAGVLALTALAYLWLQAAVMSGAPFSEASPAVAAVLTESHFGVAWSTGFVGALVATLAGVPRKHGAPLHVMGLVLWAAGKAATSHAADSGDFSSREVLHVIHLLATALWAGSVIVSGCLLTLAVRVRAAPSRQRVVYCSALSYLATAALAIVLVTGFYNVLQDTARTGALVFTMPWGRVLLMKLTFVVLTIVLGGWNRARILPRLRRQAEEDGRGYDAEQRRFDYALAIEGFAMLVVLSLAAVPGPHVTWAGLTSPSCPGASIGCSRRQVIASMRHISRCTI
jgi:putative copper resistance protein D